MHNVVTAYAESSTRGKRKTMEDASVVVPNFRGNPAELSWPRNVIRAEISQYLFRVIPLVNQMPPVSPH